MKRIVTLMLAAILVLGSVAGASAADFKAKGQWDFSFQYLNNAPDFKSEKNGGDSDDGFSAIQRLRTQVDVIASESLRGVMYFEMGNTTWGNKDGALGADGKSVEVKRSYIDWVVPNTALMVRMGLQGLALPWAVAGSPVLDDDVAALTLTYKFSDMVAATAFWARPYDTSAGDVAKDQKNSLDEIDLFGFALPITLDGAKITPWGMYANIGKDTLNGVSKDDFKSYNGFSSAQATTGLRPVNAPPAFMDKAATKTDQMFGSNTTAWWAGASFELSMFSPLSFKLDAIYGSLKGGEMDFADTTFDMDRAGWMAIAAIDYKMDMMTPGIFALYGSGDDDDATDGSERMPYVSPADFGPTSFGFEQAAAPIATDTLVSSSGTGMWMIGAQLAKISFIENLQHTLRVAYMTGTNDPGMLKKVSTLASPVLASNGLYMTDKDHAWEVNFDHFYKIYENLDLMVEMAYIKADFDDSIWSQSKDQNGDFDDAWKLGVNLKYSF